MPIGDRLLVTSSADGSGVAEVLSRPEHRVGDARLVAAAPLLEEAVLAAYEFITVMLSHEAFFLELARTLGPASGKELVEVARVIDALRRKVCRALLMSAWGVEEDFQRLGLELNP
jgi:hypothetical protein